MSIDNRRAEDFTDRLLDTPSEGRALLYRELEALTGVAAAELRESLEVTQSRTYLVERIQLFESGDLKRDRHQLVDLVGRIIAADGSEAQIDEWLRVIAANVPAPIGYVTDLIFHSGEALPDAVSVVEKALTYQPQITLL